MSKPKQRKVLIVDDFPAMRNSVKEIMETKGFDCTEACNGLEALTELKKQKFDIVVSDLVMPEMDGFELCDNLKNNKELSSIPFIVLSTQTDVRFVMKALKLGADDYLYKPIESDLLEKILKRVFIAEDNLV